VRVRTMIAFDNGRRATSEAVIVLDGGDDPYKILSWRDDDDATATRSHSGKAL
jgi:general secretion pathway protein K